MTFFLRPLAISAVLAITAPMPSLAEDQPCPMAGKTYKYRFDEFFRGKIGFNQDCSLMMMDFANGPAVFKLEPNLRDQRGWIAKFNQGMADPLQKGDITISETGTLLTFRIGAGRDFKSRLHRIKDTP